MKSCAYANLSAEQARAGKTDIEMAKLLGIKHGTYSAKKHNATFSIDEGFKLVEFFGLPFDYLFSKEPTVPKFDKPA